MSTIVVSRGKRQKDVIEGIDIRDDSDSGTRMESDITESLSGLVTPGDIVTEDSVWMRGHGTYSVDSKTYSSVAGRITNVNKLLSVTPLKGKYQPVIGDHVIGRITEVGNKRWKVDIGASQDAVLMLGSVNLPGGVLRRKSESDELQMREFLKEGDLLNAEVQGLFSDGGVSLHTRSLRYGKLRNGYFLSIPSSQVLRLRTHLYRLSGGVDMILGINGYIWLSKSQGDVAKDVSITRIEEESSLSIYSDKNDAIPASIRQNIAIYANCIRALSFAEVGINESRLMAAYEACLVYKNAGELIENNTKAAIAGEVLANELR